jgi:flavodoxin
MKNTLIIVHSHHHGNTIKIAQIFAEKLNATISEAQKLDIKDVKKYDLIGFGSGIDGGKHYPELLKTVQRIPANAASRQAFIFSTSAVLGNKHTGHKALRKLLEQKGFSILGEFSCPGFTTKSVFTVFGGKNKGRPNADDIKDAQIFAEKLASL